MGLPIQRYGLEFPDEWTELQVELCCFRIKHPIAKGGLGRYGHYRKICEMLWPEHELTEWAEMMQRRFCGEPRKPGRPLNVVVTGPASSTKSTEVARFAVVWQQMAPLNSAIPVTSTSVKMAKKRIWAEIVSLWEMADRNSRKLFGGGIAGHIVNSSCELQAERGDAKHAIAIVPGSQEFVSQGKKKLIGWHAEFVLIVADELQDMTEEVIESCVNMQSGTREFIFLGVGNGNSWFNTLGKTMMPESGNPEDVNVDMEEWNTKDGICLHLDGLKCPNVLEYVPGKKPKYPWLVTQEHIDGVVAKHGEDSLHYWQMVRGFPPPDGSINAVVPESLILKFSATQPQQLLSSEPHASLDPAFGGDRCTLKFADVGTFTDHSRKGVVFTETMAIHPKPSATEPLDYQIAHQVMDNCKRRGVRPANFSMDGTGIGRGIAAILRKEWSNEIHVVDFGGSASELPVSDVDFTKGKDAYANRSSELWMSFRTFVVNGQVRGLSESCAREFGARTYTTIKGKTLIATKLEVKKVLGRSPDDADAAVLIVDNMRNQGFFAGPMGFDVEWTRMVNKTSSLEPGYKQTESLLMY